MLRQAGSLMSEPDPKQMLRRKAIMIAFRLAAHVPPGAAEHARPPPKT